MSSLIFVISFLMLWNVSFAFNFCPRLHLPLRVSRALGSKEDKSPDELQAWEISKVEKGLTHIKYNKFAPSAEEAATMTDAEFRAAIYKRMKEAERERRTQGRIGGLSSNDYINSLGKKPK